MDLKLTDFIKVYDNVLSKGECNSCIKIFEEGVDKKVYDTEHLKFTQFWIPTNSYTPLFNNIKSKMNRRHSDYKSYLSECLDYVNLFPPKYSFEKFKIKDHSLDQGSFNKKYGGDKNLDLVPPRTHDQGAAYLRIKASATAEDANDCCKDL